MRKPTEPLPHHLQDFLDWLDVERGLSSKSQENYHHFLEQFFIWLRIRNLENIPPRALTLDHIRQYRIYLSRTRNLKKSTQNYYLIALRSLLSYFVEHNVISLPPEKVKLAREKEDHQVRFLTLDQLKNLFDAPNTQTFHGLRDRAILETFFSTGLRIAELIALNKEQIRVPKNPSEELEITIKGKGGRIRTVYFSPRALDWIAKYLAERHDSHDALFITYRSEKKKMGAKRITARTIQHVIKAYALQAGISPDIITPHVMRHSFATDLLAQGVDIRTLQEFLGHKDISATQIYAHITSKQLRDTHKKFHSGQRLG